MTTTKTYLIQSVRLSELGSVGDTVELSDEEYNDLPYNIHLQLTNTYNKEETTEE